MTPVRDADRLNELVVGRIRVAMAVQRVSQKVVGNCIGHGQRYVSYRLTGQVPLTLDDVEAFAAALGIPIDRLLIDESPAQRRRAS